MSTCTPRFRTAGSKSKIEREPGDNQASRVAAVTQVGLSAVRVRIYSRGTFTSRRVDSTRNPVGSYLSLEMVKGEPSGTVRLSGQARILALPSVFMDPTQVRLYPFSATEAFHTHRPRFLDEVANAPVPFVPLLLCSHRTSAPTCLVPFRASFFASFFGFRARCPKESLILVR